MLNLNPPTPKQSLQVNMTDELRQVLQVIRWLHKIDTNEQAFAILVDLGVNAVREKYHQT